MDLRVVLVEDSRSVRNLLAELFDSIGGLRVVGTVASEPQARAWFEQHPGGWDLAVVDLVLDEGSGIGVIRCARQASPTARVVVFSSYATPGMREHCLRLGADAAFSKGEMEAFARWVREVVRS